MSLRIIAKETITIKKVPKWEARQRSSEELGLGLNPRFTPLLVAYRTFNFLICEMG